MSGRESLFQSLSVKLLERSTTLATASRDAVGDKRRSLMDDAELLADAAAAMPDRGTLSELPLRATVHTCGTCGLPLESPHVTSADCIRALRRALAGKGEA